MIKMYSRDFNKIREDNGLTKINKCSLCHKKFELNSGVFFTKERKPICKECYKKFSKQDLA